MEVCQILRQFNFKLGKDYFPGDVLFSPFEIDLFGDRETVRVTTKPYSIEVREIPRECVVATEFVVETHPLMPLMRPVRDWLGVNSGQ